MQSFTSSTPLPIFADADFQFTFKKPVGNTVDEETPDASGEEDNLFTPPPSPGRVDPNASGEESLFTPTHTPSRFVLGKNDGENSPYVTSSLHSKASENPSHGLGYSINKENNSPLVQLPVAPQNDTKLSGSRPVSFKFITMTGQKKTRAQRVPTEPRRVPSRKRKARPEANGPSTSMPATMADGQHASPSTPRKRQRTSNSGGFSSQQSHFTDVTPAPTTLGTLTWEQVKYLPTHTGNDNPPVHAKPGEYVHAGFVALQPWWG